MPPAVRWLYEPGTRVGHFSPRTSISYLPRVSARGSLFLRDQYLYDQEIYHGVDARDGKAWAIASNEKDAYPNFETVVANIDSVRKAFEAGAREISKRMSVQIHNSIK